MNLNSFKNYLSDLKNYNAIYNPIKIEKINFIHFYIILTT